MRLVYPVADVDLYATPTFSRTSRVFSWRKSFSCSDRFGCGRPEA